MNSNLKSFLFFGGVIGGVIAAAALTAAQALLQKVRA